MRGLRGGLGLWLMSGDDVELVVKGVYTHGSSSGTTGRSISLPCCRHPFSVSSKFRRSVCREVVEGRRVVVVRADWLRLVHQATG